jgi:hypothetical protein
VELRGLEPLTSSMPSTIGLRGGRALRLAIGHPGSAVDCDCASGLVSSLGISVLVSRSTHSAHIEDQSGLNI